MSEVEDAGNWLVRRRAQREERRRKQREANIGRAAKMHAARVEFRPKRGAKKRELPKEIVGCSGWFYWHWRGRFYSSELPTREWFGHYASKFKTVELNAPFYSWPTVGTVNTWKRQAGRRKFIYTVKVCELITHVKRFAGTRELIEDFYFISELLGPLMGCFLFQLPPSFRFTEKRLERIVSQLDPARRNVVEFRHRSWWNAKVFEAFKKRKIIFCSTSGPRLPDELVKTADEVYIRFHGLKKWYRHDYTKEELAVWVERIRASGAKRVWAYFNNDRDANAIRNARQLMRMLRVMPAKKRKSPMV